MDVKRSSVINPDAYPHPNRTVLDSSQSYCLALGPVWFPKTHLFRLQVSFRFNSPGLELEEK